MTRADDLFSLHYWYFSYPGLCINSFLTQISTLSSSVPTFNDSGIEAGLNFRTGCGSPNRIMSSTLSSRLLPPHMSKALLAQLAADSSFHNTNRFPSHDSYDSDSSSDSEIPLRSIHNRENSTTKGWYKVNFLIYGEYLKFDPLETFW